MRTSFERRAAHVTILCRRRGTVCPQLVDWLNFVRPFDDDFRHDAAGDAVVLSHWHGVYDASHARRPECWLEGLLKPDGHTVSVSDLFPAIKHPSPRGRTTNFSLEAIVTIKRDIFSSSINIAVRWMSLFASVHFTSFSCCLVHVLFFLFSNRADYAPYSRDLLFLSQSCLLLVFFSSSC